MSRSASHIRIPAYCPHKARGTAYVRLDGHVHYLPGPFGSAESRAEYDRLIALWTLNGRRLPGTSCSSAGPYSALAGPLAVPVSSGLTITELVDAFLAECDREYPTRDGKRNTELASIESAMFSLNKLYGPTPASAFKPLHMENVLRDYVTRGLCRKMANRNLSYGKRLFKWAVKHEYVSGETFYRLLTVEGLRKGRSNARDNPPVRAVDEAVVEATLPCLSAEVAAMVKLQLLTGMRSGEVTRLRRGDIDMTGPVWRYKLVQHKTAHHGITRHIPLGPKAQEIIRPFLTADETAYLFSPAQAEMKRREKMHEARETPLSCGNRPGSNRKQQPQRSPGERYASDTYGRAIRRACCQAFPFPENLLPNTRGWTPEQQTKYVAKHGEDKYEEHHAKVMAWHERHFWHPHQLRHSAATRVARAFGEISSQNLLGHTTMKTTAIYLERDWKRAEEAMAAMG